MTVTFSLEPAAHVNNRLMVHAILTDENGTILSKGWFELHRLQPESPTGVYGIIEFLKRGIKN